MIPDRWLVVELTLPAAADAGLVAQGLVDRGARAVVEDRPGSLRTHFPPPVDPQAFLTDLSGSLQILAACPVELTWHWQKHEDWAETWKRGLRTRKVSRRVTVAPTWEEAMEPEDGVLVSLDPGLAFGTAEHASTRGAIRLLDDVLARGDRVADIGAGSAILSITAARLGARSVLAVEGDPLACPTARDNAATNGVADVVTVEERMATSEWIAALWPLDGVLANIEHGVLTPLLSGFRRALEPRGWLIVAGVLEAEAPEFVKTAAEAGMRLERQDREDGWWAACFRPVGAEPA